MALRQNGNTPTEAAGAIVRKADSRNPAPPDYSGYRPGIDGLRPITVLAVVGFHVVPGRDPHPFSWRRYLLCHIWLLDLYIIMKGLEAGTFTYTDILPAN